MKPTSIPSTSFVLAMKYQKTTILLDDVIKEYMPHISIEYAKRRAQKQALPFPVFRAEDTKKSPYFVNVSDLANWLDSQTEKGRSEWHKVNS